MAAASDGNCKCSELSLFVSPAHAGNCWCREHIKRGGVATVLCPGQAQHFTVTPARDEHQIHISVLVLRSIHLTTLHLEEEVLG